jgi:16S rRNA (adenine1518-N6/adenine1519-N6)-dimethyltransferase
MQVTQAAFGQRRKALRNALQSLPVDAGALLERAGIDPGLRAEAVDIEGFCALARAYADMAAPSPNTAS